MYQNPCIFIIFFWGFATNPKRQRGLILKATHTDSGRMTAEAPPSGTRTKEVEVVRVGAANCTAPIEAEGPNIVDRTSDVVAATRHGQFKRRGKSPCTIITAPT